MATSDMILLGIGAFVAVVTLVRLMRANRDQLVARFHSEMTAETQRLKQQEKLEKKRLPAKK